MKIINLYFQIHQPFRLAEYVFFQIGKDHFYENDQLNKEIFEKISKNCYTKTNRLLDKLCKKFPNKFGLSFSMSGMFLEALQKYDTQLLKSFSQLVENENVEMITETYYHSLSSIFDKEEFVFQIKKHQEVFQGIFNSKSKIFRNTELIFNNNISNIIENLGFEAMLAEGVDRVLKKNTPNQIFKTNGNLKLFARNHIISDSIAFKFSDKNDSNYPLTVEKFISLVNSEFEKGEVINLFIDYETFGEHQNEETGIFEFLEKFITKSIENESIVFNTLSNTLALDLPKTQVFESENAISWADSERDLSAWMSNSMQYESLNKIFKFKDEVLATHNEEIIHTWRKLQTSDHFYYMCTKYWADGDVHKYFSPYKSPYDAYIYYMNILSDLDLVLKKYSKQKN